MEKYCTLRIMEIADILSHIFRKDFVKAMVLLKNY